MRFAAAMCALAITHATLALHPGQRDMASLTWENQTPATYAYSTSRWAEISTSPSSDDVPPVLAGSTETVETFANRQRDVCLDPDGDFLSFLEVLSRSGARGGRYMYRGL